MIISFNICQKNKLLKLLKEHDYNSMCEWSYCCYGMYTCCWQELTADGVWEMTQENVNKSIAATIKDCMKYCKKIAEFYMQNRKIALKLCL